jgi:YwiC-like protein
VTSGAGPGTVPLRSVAVPVEHGGWGFLVEPIVLGLALAPSRSGVLIALAALAAFLARHPLKLALGDRRRTMRYPRTALAERVALAYLAAALAALLLALGLASARFWLPIALAAPFAALQVYSDARGRNRDLAAELSGALALASTVAVITLAGSWPAGAALLLWLLLVARASTSILYVRARLRLDRGASTGSAPVVVAHLVGLALVAGLAALGAIPWLAVVALAILFVRAAHGVSRYRRPLMPKALGFQELGFGTLTVFLLALGYILGV